MSNFSLQYPSIIQQIGSESMQMYQVEVVILIYYQIFATNLWGNVWQLEGQINNQILGVKGLKWTCSLSMNHFYCQALFLG